MRQQPNQLDRINRIIRTVNNGRRDGPLGLLHQFYWREYCRVKGWRKPHRKGLTG